MSNRIITLAAAALALFAVEASAQVTASSYSTGGTAISRASGHGNTRLNATSIATNGGFARATMQGSGWNGGRATGNSLAVASGGIALSNGRSHANGWGARSHADSTAVALGGIARSNGTAIARGNWANARAGSIAIGQYGQYSNSSSQAIDRRVYQAPVYQTPVYSQPTYQYYGN